MFPLVLAGCVDRPRSGGTVRSPPPPAGTEDVLVVVLDDLAADHVDLYDPTDPAPPTPTLDALAAEGTTFRNAWSMALCSPSRASLLTGRYPTRTGLGMVVEFEGVAPGASPLPLSEQTLAELVGPAGWDTSMVGKWHVAGYRPGAERDPGEQGFAWYAGSVGNLDIPDHSRDYFDWVEDDNGTLRDTTVYATTASADAAIGRMRAMSEPWLLYLAFNAPHSPYHVPPADLVDPESTDRVGQYRAMITAADHELGRVIAAMSPDLRARTTIVVVGDNGTPDDLLIPGSDRLKYTEYQGGVHVPLIVAGPRVAVPGSVTEALVDVTDVFPTVAEIAGVPLADGDVDGRSFLPILTDPTATVRDLAYSELFWSDDEQTYAIRDDRYKLVVTENWPYGPDGTENGVELYDLQTDPDETTDLAADPASAGALSRLTAAADELRSAL